MQLLGVGYALGLGASPLAFRDTSSLPATLDSSTRTSAALTKPSPWLGQRLGSSDTSEGASRAPGLLPVEAPLTDR